MNLTIERTPALAALSRVVGVVDRNHSVDICANVLVKAEDGALTFRGTDMDMEATERLPADIATAGGITLPADKLHDIVRSADPGCQVKMAIEDGDPRTKVSAGRSRFSVPSLPTDSFPEFPVEGLGEEFAIPAQMLSSMLSRVLWATSKSKALTPTSCVYLASTPDQLHAVGATEAGVALARAPLPEGASIQVLLLPKTVGQILKWIGDYGGDLQVSSSERLIRLRHPDGQIISKVYDPPKYLPYERVVMEEHDLCAVTDQDALKSALRRALIMADEKSHSIRVTITPGEDGASMSLQMRGVNAAEGMDEIPVDYEGPERSLLFKASALESVLTNLRGDRVSFGFSQPDATGSRSIAVVIKAPADASYLVTLAQPRA